jgi:predicted transposase YbfD/YdcC
VSDALGSAKAVWERTQPFGGTRGKTEETACGCRRQNDAWDVGAWGGEPAKKAKSNKKAKKQVMYVEETSQQVVYGLTTLTPTEASPQAIATFSRDHWAVENRLYWRRDVTWRQDHSHVRTAGRPEVLAALNNVVLALMDWLGVRNVPEQMRIFSAFPRLALELLLGPLTFE